MLTSPEQRGALHASFFSACEHAGTYPWTVMADGHYGIRSSLVSLFLTSRGLPPIAILRENTAWFPHDAAATPDTALVFAVSAEGLHANEAKLIPRRDLGYPSVSYADVVLGSSRPAGRRPRNNNPSRGGKPSVRGARVRRPGRAVPRRRETGSSRSLRPNRATTLRAAPTAVGVHSSAQNSVPYTYSGSETVMTVTNLGAGIAIVSSSPALFPLGYRVMGTYSRYRFTRLAFIYEPAVSTASSGSVWLSFSPTKLPEPLSLTSASTAASSASSSVWAPCRLEIRYEPTQRWLLNYSSSVWDYKGPDYNLGLLYATVIGDAPEGVLGTLRVEYTVVLVDRANTLPNPTGPLAPLVLQAPQGLRAQAEDPDLRGLLERLERLERKDLSVTQDPPERKDLPATQDQPEPPAKPEPRAPLDQPGPQVQPEPLELLESQDPLAPLDPPALVRSRPL